MHIHFDQHVSSPSEVGRRKFSSSLINHNLEEKQNTLDNHSLLNNQGPIISPCHIVVVIWFHLFE
jgi:hypothetical protein